MGKTGNKAIGLEVPAETHLWFRMLAASEGKSMKAKAKELIQQAVEKFIQKQAQARRIDRGEDIRSTRR